MELEEITKQEFQTYTRSGSIFDQMSWRLRPENIAENGVLSKADLEWLCYHFYVYGVADSNKIKEKAIHDRQNPKGVEQE